MFRPEALSIRPSPHGEQPYRHRLSRARPACAKAKTFGSAGLLIFACWGAVSLSGCQSIIHAVDSHNQFVNASQTARVRRPEQISNETWTVLRYWDLDQSYLRDAEGTLEKGMRLFRDHPNQEWAVALSELSYRAGESRLDSERGRTPLIRVAHKQPPEYRLSAEEYYLNSASYAYYFLFAEGKPINEFDRRVATACRFYNAGLEKCLSLAHQQGGFAPQKPLTLKTANADIVSPVDYKGFVWRTDEFNEIQFVSHLHPADDPRPRQSLGLGVPLIALRHRHDDGDARERFLVKRHPFAATAFFRPDLTRLTPYAPQDTLIQTAHSERRLLEKEPGREGGVLELYDPRRITQIRLNGMWVPLEADLSAPMEFVLSNTRQKKFEWGGFFNPDSIQEETGLYMIEPYQKGKIPVICVHGLLSGPLTWNTMYESLWSDPKIRDNYQVWFFLYPTGAPFLASARKLRQEIEEIGILHGKDTAARQMVLIGHSMGGLLSKLQVTESDDKLWNLVSKQPLDKLKTDDETRSQLQQTFFFDAQPAITRVVYIATPHKGSQLSDAPLGRLGSWLVQAPQKLKMARKQLVHDNPGAFDTRFASGVANSVDMLSYNNPILQTMYEMPYESDVHLHSIIGTKNDNVIGSKGRVAVFLTGDKDEPGDGVVPIKSAQIPNVESETMVPTTHEKVHRHPLAYQEVNRILHLHLESVQKNEPIQQLNSEEHESVTSDVRKDAPTSNQGHPTRKKLSDE